MIKNRKLTFLFGAFIALAIVLSCTEPESYVYKRLEVAIALDTLQIPIQDGYSESPLPKWHYKVIDDSDYLVTGNLIDDQLFLSLLNIESREYEAPVTLPMYGPNGFKSSTVSFYVHSLDSIFVFPTSQNKIYLYGRDETITNIFEFASKQLLSFSSNEQQQGTVLFNDKLYLNAIPYTNPNDLDFFKKTFSSYVLDLKTSVLIPYQKHPEKMNGKVLPTSFLGGQIVKAFDSVIVSNNFYQEGLMFGNLNDSEFNAVEMSLAGGEHISGLDGPIDNQSLSSLILQIKYPQYYNVLYDRHRNLIYRIVKHINRKYENLTDNQIFNELQNQNGELFQNALIVLGPDKKIIKRIKIPFSDFYIPIEEGLLIRSFTEESENFNEFVILKID